MTSSLQMKIREEMSSKCAVMVNISPTLCFKLHRPECYVAAVRL
jgi:hypothetical protein